MKENLQVAALLGLASLAEVPQALRRRQPEKADKRFNEEYESPERVARCKAKAEAKRQKKRAKRLAMQK